MKFCRQIDQNNRIFYDPTTNEFLINSTQPLEVDIFTEYKILEIVEQSEIAGLSQSDILYAVSGLLI